jgi:hypothetical protein
MVACAHTLSSMRTHIHSSTLEQHLQQHLLAAFDGSNSARDLARDKGLAEASTASVFVLLCW